MDGESLLILLVEDNPDHAELVIRVLEENRIANHVHHVEDGEAALNYVNQLLAQGQTGTFPNLIMLDIHMPKLNGIEVLEVIKQNPRLKLIPVVMLTSSKSEADVTRAYTAHANSYLVKPVDFAGFSRMMIDLGRYWLGWNTNPFSATNRQGVCP